MNRDVSVIRDYSSGSNATTLLCSGNNGTVFKKYAFGEDGDKLYEQVLWLKAHKSVMPITDIVSEKKTDCYYCYEMPYIPNSMGMFEYVHRASFDESWALLEAILNTLINKLYSYSGEFTKVSVSDILEYADKKVISNIKKIQRASMFSKLLFFDEIVINGVKYDNLPYYMDFLSKDKLLTAFENDIITHIHGDITMENIIVTVNGQTSWYIIDPNTTNLVDSPNLDYAKFLQSLHGGYEFMMRTEKVEVIGNRIVYDDSYSLQYDRLYNKYKEWLSLRFSQTQCRSIFYHEVIHWLRLMPYKINNDSDRAALFYAGLLKVLNDVDRMFGGTDEK
jgi:hypothetical protein